MHKKQRPVQKNDHINFENGTLQWRKMTNMRYAKFSKLRKIKFILLYNRLYNNINLKTSTQLSTGIKTHRQETSS